MMQFRHPEILYFLFLLVIPILVHLFQLRRFKKSYFTNVRFLKELSIQTRKSSQLKKWLLLAARLLLLAFAVFAFAQPFFPAKDHKDASNELYVILDNSFSMQAKGQQGELLQRAIQDLLEEMPEEQNFSLLTNDAVFWKTEMPAIRKEVQALRYSARPFSAEQQIARVMDQQSAYGKDVLLITDAVGLEAKSLEKAKSANTWMLIPEAQQKRNIAIDSVYLKQALDRFYEIGIKFKAYGEGFEDLPVSLFNRGKLIAKTLVKPERLGAEIAFTIPKADFDGYVSIDDKGLPYDDRFYFSISKPQKTNVMAVGTPEANTFLNRIYTEDEFDFTAVELKALDYSKLEQQDAVVLNELPEIPQALQTTLKAFVEKGGNLIVVPAANAAPAGYNSLLRNLGSVQLGNWSMTEKKISQIHFTHPLYKSVFEKRIENFQYPVTRSGFTLSGNISAALSYEDQSAFLASVPQKNGQVFVFAAPVNKTDSNLQNAPIIVPTFYTMAQSGLRSGLRWNTIGQPDALLVAVALGKDELITLADVDDPTQKFTPLQQILNNKVKLTFTDFPEKAGNYILYRNNQPVGQTSFNYARTESNPAAANPDAASDFKQASSLGEVLHQMATGRTDSQLWKWFVILALLMLCSEILIQKLLK